MSIYLIQLCFMKYIMIILHFVLSEEKKNSENGEVEQGLFFLIFYKNERYTRYLHTDRSSELYRTEAP